MIPGLHGSLLSHDALSQGVPAALRTKADAARAAEARARIVRWLGPAAAQMGPSSTARAVFDQIAAPLTTALGFRVTLTGGAQGGSIRAVLEADGTPAAALLVTEWGREPASAWRESVHHGIASGLRWCFCVTGPSLRVFDTQRTYTRRFAEFELADTAAHVEAFEVLWYLLGAPAFTPPGPASVLERAVVLSEQHRSAVRASLQQGVHEALSHLLRAFAAACRPARRGPLSSEAAFDESLTVIYRVLFLLFAEARGLVPQWHPVYRESYTIESLRPMVEQLPRPRGVWEALQAIARLAHRGCEAGALRMPPFNGRLFSPAHAPLAESSPLDDGAVRQALLALTTRAGRGGRVRISYADLGVEQLGGVYERILDFEAAPHPVTGAPALVPATRRKSTGSFYTPRSLTEYVVRRALAPLVHDATPDRILSLRVLDPAMGSGAFLVAACRYLAAAYELSLVREGVASAADITEPERAGFRRAIAQRCLYGVDINPMAVQLGRLSLWLATLSGDRPLTFLDHHLRAGNSLVGASPADVARQPPPSRGQRRRAAALPLFEWDAAERAIGAAVGPRISLANDAGDTLEQVRAKERTLAGLEGAGGPVTGWKAVSDLWCAGWFGTGWSNAAIFNTLADGLIRREPGRSALPDHVTEPLLAGARTTAARERFFHWTLEFPEVFHAHDGQGLGNPGFDAVIGNPPWEMLRADHGDSTPRLTAFTRTSGTYALQGDGHGNLYQVFLERSLSLLRDGGRLGLVLPSGLATDHGCAALRRHVLDRSSIDTFVSVENREGLFPIHRGLRFLLVCTTGGGRTPVLPLRSGVRSPDVLDQLPDAGPDPAAIPLPRALLERASGPQLAIPEIRSREDLALFSRLVFSAPALGDAEGWNARFGRELNASDHRKHFIEFREHAGQPARATPVAQPSRAAGAPLPVLEGKQVQPFTVDVRASRFHLPQKAARLLDPDGTWQRARLVYRDVASATNRLTLIAAIIPPGVVTTHTLFCLKDDVAEEAQQFLCGVFNSYVANYLVRLRVSTHVGAAIISRLPVPRPSRDSIALRTIAELSAYLAAAPHDPRAAAELQAQVARLYNLTSAEFTHVLSTFPLIDPDERRRASEAFEAIGNREPRSAGS